MSIFSFPFRRKAKSIKSPLAKKVRPAVELLEERVVLNADTERFVGQTYRDLLSRDVDASGLKHWSGLLDGGMARSSMSLAIVASSEYENQLIASTYQRFLDRPPELIGLSAWQSYLHPITQSMYRIGTFNATAPGHSQQEMEAAIAGSSEAFARSGGTSATFVNQLYRTALGRDADARGLAAWTSPLATGWGTIRIAAGIINSDEAMGKRVESFYSKYLGRVSDPLRSDWIALLKQGVPVQQIVAGFIASPEYLQISTRGSNNSPPTASLSLENDTAPNNSVNADKLTRDTSLIGAISPFDSTLQALDVDIDGKGFVDARVGLLTNGQFRLSAVQLAALNNGPLADGVHTVRLRATKTNQTAAIAVLDFTLDSTSPVLALDTPLSGSTTSPSPVVSGQISGGTALSYALDSEPSKSAVVGSDGHFEVTLSDTPLPSGNHVVVFTPFDSAGNAGTASFNFSVGSNIIIGPSSSNGQAFVAPNSILLQEKDSFVVQATVPVTSGSTNALKGVSFSVDSFFDKSDHDKSSADQLQVYLTDPSNPTASAVSGIEPGKPVFSLGESGPSYVAGHVRFDGHSVTVELADTMNPSTVNVVFQLLSQDSDPGTTASISQIAGITTLESTVDSSLLSVDAAVFSPGTAVSLSEFGPASGLTLGVSNIQLDTTTGRYTADLKLKNTGAALGRSVVVLFDGLPPSAALGNASGTNSQGVPYINFLPGIPAGGLETNATSKSVRVQFDDPSLVRFFLKPTFLAGSANRAPVFVAQAPVSVMPGNQIDIPLNATDPDGDPVSFSLVYDASLPLMRQNGNTSITVAPSPEQVGTYDLTVMATDGVATSSQIIHVNVVADPLTSTRISAQVLSVSGQPLANVPIELGRFQTRTDSDGRFTLQFAASAMLTSDFDVQVPLGDPQFDPYNTGVQTIPLRRAVFDPSTGTGPDNPRQQVSQVSAFLDAGVVYGSDLARSAALRRNDGSGKLKTSANDLLPFNNATYFPNGPLPNDNDSIFPADTMFVAGDVRASENVGLASLHTVLVREHNRLADLYRTANPTWSDEQIYQASRKLVCAFIDQITYYEFLPALLGSSGLPSYQGYDPTINPQVSAMFSAAAFRVGHTLFPPDVPRTGSDGQTLPGGSLTLRDSFFNTQPIVADGIDPFLRGAAGQIVQEVDNQVIDEMRNFLFGPPGSGGLDLPALNIQRGRDMGLPDYNTARADFGLPRVSSFAEITSNPELQAKLQEAYGSVDNIDPWVGGVCEDRAPDSAVGPFFAAVIRDQFRRSRDGDRLWFENGQLSPDELTMVRVTTLSSLIERNTSIVGLADNVFVIGTDPVTPAYGGTPGTSSEARSTDGAGNNLSNPGLGKTGSHILRDFTDGYGDGISTPAGAERLSARAISNIVNNQTSIVLNSRGLTNLAVLWGQLLDHDLGLTPGGTTNTIKVHADQLSGTQRFPFIAEKLPLMLEHEVYSGVNNVISRPIYLPELSNGQTVDPTKDMPIYSTEPRLAGASVLIEAGTLVTRQGHLFTGKLSITEVSAERTPATLPSNLLPDLVVTIQPGEMVFTQPAPITLPNRGGWKRGTEMDLWSINPITGVFDKVGLGIVSDDELFVNTVTGGIRNSSWHFFTILLKDVHTETDPSGCPCMCQTPKMGGMSSIDLFTGTVQESHSLATYQSLDESRGLTLTYSSFRADPSPIGHFTATFITVPASRNQQNGGGQVLAASFTLERGDARIVVAGNSEDRPGLSPNDTIFTLPTGPVAATTILGGALQADLSTYPTGQYNYEMSVGTYVADNDGKYTGAKFTNKGSISIANLVNSPFGSGWGIAGLQQLFPNPDGSVLLVDGGGTELIFKPSGDGSRYISPMGDFSQFIRLANGTFTRTLVDRTVYIFDANNRLASLRDRNGNTTAYEYTGELLTKVTDPVGLATVLTYQNGRLASVVDPAGRTSLFRFDERGNLTQIEDADQSVTSWGYDNAHHLIRTTDKLGRTGSDQYDSSGRAIGATFPDGREVRTRPFLTQGLAGTTPENQLVVSQKARKVIYTDGNGNPTEVTLDEMGEAIAYKDLIGTISTTQLDEQDLVTSRTNGRDNLTTYTYNDNGQVTSIVDEVAAGLDFHATIFWVGPTDGDWDWDNPFNWNKGEVPGPNDDVLVNVSPANATVLHPRTDTIIRNLRIVGNLELSSSSLTITGKAVVTGALTVRNASLNVQGLGASFIANGPTILESANLTAKNGAELSLPMAIEYDGGTGGTFDGRELIADGAGSLLSLSNLTKLIGRKTGPGTLVIAARNGGAIDFSNLADVVAGPQGGTAKFEVSAVSQIRSGNLKSAESTEFIIPGDGLMNTAQIISLTKCTITIGSDAAIPLPAANFRGLTNFSNNSLTLQGGGAIDLRNVSRIDAANITVGGGVTLSLPLVNRYDGGTGSVYDDRSLIADGVGSVLDLSHIVTVIGRNSFPKSQLVIARNGGTIDLSSLTDVSAGPQSGTTRFEASAGSRIRTEKLKTVDHGVFVLSGADLMDTAQIETLTIGSITIDPNGGSVTPPVDFRGLTNFSNNSLALQGGGAIDLRNVSRIDAANITVAGGVTLSLPLVDRYDGGIGSVYDDRSLIADGAGSVLDLSHIATAIGRNSFPKSQLVIARNGGTIDLSSLTNISAGPQSGTTRFEASAGSRIRTENLNTVDRGVFVLSGADLMDTAQIEILTNGSITIDPNGGSVTPPVDFNGLTEIDGSTLMFKNGGAVAAANFTVPSSSTLAGSGSFVGNVVVSGVVSPGDSTGLLTVQGTFALAAASSLNIEIGGITNQQFDQLLISGNATLGGTLNISVINGFRPVTGDRFPVLAFASKTGNFATVNGLMTGDGVVFALAPSSTGVDLVVQSSPYARSQMAPFAAALSTSVDIPTSDAMSLPVSVTATSPPLIVIAQTATPLTGKRFAYESTFNQLTTYTDELDHKTLFDIDPANGNVRSKTQVIGTTGGTDDLATAYTYTSRGQIKTTTDPRGNITENEYNAVGRLISVTFAKGTEDEAIRRYEYDLAGNRTAVIDENGHRTEYEFDRLNRVTKMIEADPDGPGTLTSPLTKYEYDDAGNLKKMTDARNVVTEYFYDRVNRLIRVVDNLQQETKYDYDKAGNLIAVTDPLGHQTKYTYDRRNRRIETIDPDGGITKYGYDLDNNMNLLTDPVHNVTQFLFDARGRQIEETDPFLKKIVYEYDSADNLIRKTDRNGRVTEFAYDDINRVKQETWIVAGQPPANVIQSTYDKSSNLLSITDSFSALTYTYDHRGRVKAVDNLGTPGAPNAILAYIYDGVGNVRSVSDNIDGQPGAVTSYLFDNLNRTKEITQTGTGLKDKRVDFSYNALGQYATINRYSDLGGNQFVVGSTYHYDSLNRLDSLTHANSTDTRAFYNYTFDAASRIRTLSSVDGTAAYSYDNRDQLTTANNNNTAIPDESYEYDANGNRVDSHLQGAHYVTDKGNRLTSNGTYNYEYDDEGNTVKRSRIAGAERDGSTVREFTWDHHNRLVAVIDRTATGIKTMEARYTYDALNRRISKSVDSTPTDGVEPIFTAFTYDREDIVLDFIDIDGNGSAVRALSNRYFHGPAIDEVLAQDNGRGASQWLVGDHLGTIRDVINDVGQTVNHVAYDSFGLVGGQTSSIEPSRFGFAGREYDAETGLWYLRARYLNSEEGRFVGEDPLRVNASDSNLFRYVGANPVSRHDSFGLFPDRDTIVGDGQWYWDILSGMGSFLPGGVAPQAAFDAGLGRIRQFSGFYAQEYGDTPGETNAIQHMMWQALLAYKYGTDQARMIGDQHESLQCFGNEDRIRDTEADNRNNQLGRYIGDVIRMGDLGGMSVEAAINERIRQMLKAGLPDLRGGIGGNGVGPGKGNGLIHR